MSLFFERLFEPRRRGVGLTGVLGAMLGGAAMMYFFDAQSGGRRRALVRDKAVRARHLANDALADVEHDLQNRSRGVMLRIGQMLRMENPSDEVLVERVHAKLGHVCSHPSAIEVHAKGKGAIELKGPVLLRERIPVLAAIAAIPGVRIVDDDLEVHASADIPSLQGESRRASVLTRHWNPTTRFLIGATGALFALRGIIERGVFGGVNFGGGAALIAASMLDRPNPRTIAQRLQQRAGQSERMGALGL